MEPDQRIAKARIFSMGWMAVTPDNAFSIFGLRYPAEHKDGRSRPATANSSSSKPAAGGGGRQRYRRKILPADAMLRRKQPHLLFHPFWPRRSTWPGIEQLPDIFQLQSQFLDAFTQSSFAPGVLNFLSL